MTTSVSSRIEKHTARNALLPLWLAALLFSSASHAQIYKWVDEQGRTHYSERNDGAGTARSQEIKVNAPASSSQASSAQPDWKDKERQFQERQARKSADQGDEPSASSRPKSLSGGRKDESAQGKCNLAKDIVNRTVRRTNGAPIDQYDIETAKNDINSFCK